MKAIYIHYTCISINTQIICMFGYGHFINILILRDVDHEEQQCLRQKYIYSFNHIKLHRSICEIRHSGRNDAKKYTYIHNL